MHEFEIGISESISRDLSKCRMRNVFKPIWVLAAENNAKTKVVRVRNVKTTMFVLGVN